MSMYLPELIRSALEECPFREDTMGKSTASVLLLPHQVLKIQPDGDEAQNEVRMLRWLGDKLPVPAVLAHAVERGTSYLLMERCEGAMACDDRYLDAPEELVELLANGLKALWAVDVSGCPSDQGLTQKLAQARYNVDHGLVDLEDAAPSTFGHGGFRDPAHLLEWLEEHRPAEESALSHGDFCLPNLFGTGAVPTGFIDLGKAGVADRWCDIALCCRSLSANLEGRYGGVPRPYFDPDRLFDALGLEPDEEKLRYYILLDELF